VKRGSRRGTALALGFALAGSTAGGQAPAGESADVSLRVAQSLAGRRVAASVPRTRSLRPAPLPLTQVFERSVGAVPFLVSGDVSGTAIVISVDPGGASARVVTSSHLVGEPFHDARGAAYVKLLFYTPAIGGELFEAERLERCQAGAERGDWCRALRDSLRDAFVEAVDGERDLALLRVPHPPPGLVPLPGARIEDVLPGDDVAVIGHPHGLLWTLTQGIVSSVRRRYPMGSALGTVVQTQAPVGEGSSGGPVLDAHGRFVGLVSWVVPNAQGFNAAVGVDEVLAFSARHR
jgi:S1-C subfamily serine protease